MKLLWISNHPETQSGYGTQTRQVGKRLKAAGHDLVFLANHGQAGMVTSWEGSLVLGTGIDRYSRDILGESHRRLGRDWSISLYDAWVYDMGKGPAADPFNAIPAAGWLPVDHWPVPPTVLPWASRHYTIAMSKFGVEQFANNGVEARYVPHGIEPEYRPTPVVPGMDKSFRQLIGVPDDAFLVAIVAANIGTLHYDRKGWSEMLQGFAHLAAKHDDAFLYIHTARLGPEGVPLDVGLKTLPPTEGRVKWVDQWAYQQGTITNADMAAIYSSADVTLATSRGEGFGLCVPESMACGTPVIVSNWTAQLEHLGVDVWDAEKPGFRRYPTGWAVDVQPELDFKHMAYFGVPRIDQIVTALEEAYAKRGDQAMRDACVAEAAKYDADAVFERYWRPVLAEMEALLADEPPKPTNLAIRPNRKRRRAA